jgi:hypothetical protein
MAQEDGAEWQYVSEGFKYYHTSVLLDVSVFSKWFSSESQGSAKRKQVPQKI